MGCFGTDGRYGTRGLGIPGPGELSAVLQEEERSEQFFLQLGLGRVHTWIHKEMPIGMVLGHACHLGPGEEEQGFSNFDGHRSPGDYIKMKILFLSSNFLFKF